MRREFASIIIGIGFTIVSVILPYWIPSMSSWIIYSGLGVGVFFIVLGFSMFFWKPKKQEVQTGISAKNGSVAMQDVKNSPVRYNNPDTNITWHPSTPGFEVPTTKEILRKIGVEIQEFEEQFDRIRYKQLKNRHDEIVRATDIFEKIRTGALRHANIELQGTALLTLFKNLERELNKYPVQVGMVLQYEEERTFYAQADKASLPLINEKINQARSEMEKTELNINMAILLIKKFVNEYRD